MRSTFRKGTSLACALLAAAAIIATLPVQPAAADPGFCGVRVQGPYPDPNSNPTGANGIFTYLAKNKCSIGWSFKVVFVHGSEIPCAYIGPYALHTYSAIWADDWNLVVC
ncbi:hypothetical protein [Fodinicola feengrottensis]|uniref:Secreted protein n=1 Tax=Fodinicola feengrottensis TaxID=435914 RepID=A0ABP4S2A1_9ACTN|nr:hypothetical protein [Fodinicola feengrottensis]